MEDEDTVDPFQSRTQLPGMVQDADAPAEPETMPSRQSLLNSPLITSAPRLDPPTGDATHDEPEPPSNRLSMMSPNSRASPATPRSGSPTKGLGGFVQSAMMKRSDSVKRWSVNSPGLARAESTASNRNSILGTQLGSPTKPETQPDATTQDDSNPRPASRPASRPISSHGEDRPVTPAPLTINPQLAAAETKEAVTEGGEEENTSVPVSPSKTMDPRRWSPSKSSSWLEAALNKPESPKTKPAPNANQPAWMVELNKAKAQKTGNPGVDLSRSASVPLRKTEVKTGGLMRTTPAGSGLKSSTGLSISTSAPAEKPTLIGQRSDLVSPLLRRGSEDPASLVAKTPTTEEATTPVLKDFRANLKSRAPPSSGAGAEGEVDELQNVFGKLRRAKTEKWVAPDPLKDNILRGKSLLNRTGGPMRSERKDELKEAILKKKEEFEKAKQEGQSPTKVASPVVSEKTIPEALARRLELGRSGSFSSKSVDLPSSTSSVTSPSVASPASILDFDKTGLLSPKTRELTDIAAQIAPKPTTTSLDKEVSATKEVQSTTPKEISVPGRLSKVGGLAGRFNPALAGMLAKGPPAAASGATKTAEEEATPKPGPQLTHMTKNRARGPRRKAPTSVLKPAEETEASPVVESPPAAKGGVSSPTEEKQVTPTMPKPEFITRVDSRASAQGRRHSRSGSVADLVNSFKTKVAEEPKPAEQSSTADLPSRSPTKITRGRSATKVLEQATVFAALNQQPSEPAESKSEAASPSPARPALGHTRSKSKFHEQAAMFTTLSLQPSEVSEPTKEPVSQSPVRPALGHTRSKSKVQEQAAAFVNKMKAEPSERSAETSPVRPAMGHTRSKSKVHEQIAALAAASQKPSEAAAEADPSTPTSIRGRSRAKSIVQEKLAALATADHQMKPAEPEADMAAQTVSPRKLDMKRMSRFLDEQNQPILNPENERTSRPSSPVKQRALPDFSRTSSTKDISPVKDTKVDSEPAVSVKAGSALFGGGANAGLPQVITKPTSPPPTEPAAATTTTSPIARGLVKSPTPEPRTELPPRLPLTALSSPSFTSSRRPSVTEKAPTPEPQPEPEVQSPPPPKVPPKGARPLPATPEAEAPPVPRKDSIPLPFLPKFDFQAQPQQQAQRQAQQQAQEQPQQQPPQLPPHQQTQQQPRGLRHTRSASKYGSDAQALLSDFFGTERPRRRYTADAADVIMRRPNPGFRIQTQRAQLYQFAADGKKLPVPAHRERILFEREMYLCTHTFTNESGKKVSEVYFWVGDEVPEAATDDALLFAAREARAFGGKLVKMMQGKETSEFMQALGGIVIIRRGSSNKFDSLAQTMFCGRRFLGQVAFDEVDFAPSSLCSGFPYLITQQGKCYLWKGKGSDVDELGCARLVGMDLSLMGELEEIEEGSEPESFWKDIFGGEGPGVRPMSADHWRLKPNYEKYCGRLFCSNANASGKDQVSSMQYSF